MPPNNQQYPPYPSNQPTGQPDFNGNIFRAPAPGQMPNPMIDRQPEKKHFGLIVPLVIFILLTLLFAVLSIVFFGQMSDYKNNSDEKVAVAVKQAKAEQEQESATKFAEQSKEPLVKYVAPASSASAEISYPKTWDMYVIENKAGSSVQAYMNPDRVSDISNKENVYALRLEILDKGYSSVIKEFEAKATRGEVTVVPYKPELVESAEVGIRIAGSVRDDKVGVMVILPVRDKTIKIWTESGKYSKDFDNFVLKNLRYIP